MFRTSNPTLKAERFQQATGTGVMSLGGTMAKTGLMLLVLVATAAIGWQTPTFPMMLVGVIGGLVLALVTTFKAQWSPVTGPLYAAFQGLAVGAISAIYAESMAKTQYAGAVPLAILGTLLVLGVMLLLYATRIIKVNQTFMTVVVGATLAIGITYAVTFFGGMLWPALWQLPMYKSGPIGLVFSGFVIIVAAMNLALDFKTIEDGVKSNAPKYMEWYAGFGLLVTLVWLYLEILRLLSKLAGRR